MCSSLSPANLIFFILPESIRDSPFHQTKICIKNFVEYQKCQRRSDVFFFRFFKKSISLLILIHITAITTSNMKRWWTIWCISSICLHSFAIKNGIRIAIEFYNAANDCNLLYVFCWHANYYSFRSWTGREILMAEQWEKKPLLRYNEIRNK